MKSHLFPRLPSGLMIVLLWVGVTESATSADPSDPATVFQQRILPIFQSENASSCTDCHLAGVDLKHYLFADHRKTFVNLRDLGMIDLDEPAKSEILRYIKMAPDSGEGLKQRIDPEMRDAEYKAFATWIAASAADPELRNAPPLDPSERSSPDVPDAVIRHARADRLLDSYERNIWSLRFRCSGCHMPGGPKFQKHLDKHGDKMAWLKAEGAAASMQYLMANEDLIDIDDPSESELLLKPLDISDHGGGAKMRVGDTDYLAFLSWIEDYANIVNGRYTESSSLPEDHGMRGSEIWLRWKGLPTDWVGRPGYLSVARWNAGTKQWNPTADAIAAGQVLKNPRLGTFMHGFLMVAKDQTQAQKQQHVEVAQAPLVDAKRWPGGKFRIELRLAESGAILDTDLRASVDELPIVASTEIDRGPWLSGFKNAIVVEAAAVKIY